ncbi:MAG TPA: 3'-5' exonuclease, partial [Thiolinea sp.]|nr:3'-5' exonuclease [Thiolinea sp.]
GDPKQAIYSFRGADIHTYLQAANAVAPERQYTLDRNFRSSPELINALNTLFEQAPDPFRNQHRIGYEHVQCGGTVKNRLRTPAPMAPLRIWDWDRLDETINATTVMQKVAQAVADDIARLLQLGQQGKARIGKHPVSSGDFAVLVRSHRQGRLIKQALQHNGIASVQKSPIGIFETDEATELRLVLTAVAEGSHTGRIHRAWVTELMGGTAQDLLDFEHHPERFDQVLEHFLQLQQLWQEHGIMRMLRSWMQHFQVRENLLRYVDGERRLTNLLHLAEILHRESRTESLGMHATLRWLRQRAQASRSSTDEDHQLRLESDEHLVQIVTIHKSKGLQYPLVYCPFLWRTPGNRSDKNDWFSWHDAASGDNCLQAGQYRREEAVASHQAEEQGEDARLLYVALTRAQYQCTIGMTSGLVKKADNHSALSWLLFGHLPEAEAIMAAVAKNGMPATERQQLMQQAIQQLQRRSADSISYQGLPDAGAVHYRAPEDRQLLMSRQFSGRIAPVPRL